MPRILLVALFLFAASGAAVADSYLLLPGAVLDPEDGRVRAGWVLRVDDGVITAVGPASEVEAAGVEPVALEGMTLLPGLIDAHSHILLHPYDETSWNDQVLVESWAERAARAVVHAEATLNAGFTTLRDLGSEGAGYTDVGIREAIDKGVIPGPRLIVAGRAIVATGSYGPKGFAPHVKVPLGAEPADGADLPRVVRDQIGRGAQWVKVYADYRWGPEGEARPTFSIEELRTIVDTAASSGRPTVAHAATAEGMRRAVLAGVETIEHGSAGDEATFRMMAEHDVIWCPTLAAGEAISAYSGWNKAADSEPARVTAQKAAFRAALNTGVEICLGSDVGVFDHGDNAWEAELMVEYGMTPLAVLRAATSMNARLLHMGDRLGRLQPGYIADIIAVGGDPLTDIANLRNVEFVMQGGDIIRRP